MPNLCWISPGRVVIVKFVQVAARILKSVSVYAFSRRLFAMPPMLSHIERVNQVRLLGVLFISSLKATFHVHTVLSIIYSLNLKLNGQIPRAAKHKTINFGDQQKTGGHIACSVPCT